MAVTEKIKERLKALYPGVNLSKDRIEQICSRLTPKAAEDAEEAQIDELIKEADYYKPFAEIAKEDDMLRTLKANQKATPPPAPATPPPATEAPKEESVPAWAQALLQEVQTLKAEKQQATLKQQADTLLKDVSETFRKYAYATMPKESEALEAWAESVKADYTAGLQEQAGSSFGDGKIARGTQSPSKEAPKEVTEARAKRLLNI